VIEGVTVEPQDIGFTPQVFSVAVTAFGHSLLTDAAVKSELIGNVVGNVLVVVAVEAKLPVELIVLAMAIAAFGFKFSMTGADLARHQQRSEAESGFLCLCEVHQSNPEEKKKQDITPHSALG